MCLCLFELSLLHIFPWWVDNIKYIASPTIMAEGHNICKLTEMLLVNGDQYSFLWSGDTTFEKLQNLFTKKLWRPLTINNLLLQECWFCNFSNVVAPDHKKLYWSPFTNSISVSLQMLWPSSMAIGDTIYLLLAKHHVDPCNKFNQTNLLLLPPL